MDEMYYLRHKRFKHWYLDVNPSKYAKAVRCLDRPIIYAQKSWLEYDWQVAKEHARYNPYVGEGLRYTTTVVDGHEITTVTGERLHINDFEIVTLREVEE